MSGDHTDDNDSQPSSGDRTDYEYGFDPDARNNTAATIYGLARSGGPRLLDLGSGPGIVASHLATADGYDVTCMDADEESLRVAKSRGVGQTVIGNLDEADWAQPLVGRQFDVIILADVLEHLVDPARVLREIEERALLADDGFLVVSIPNAGHEAVIAELMRGRFDYSPTGLLDRTHIRWFTRQTFVELANDAGFEAVELHRTTRSLEQTEFRSTSVEISPDLRREMAELNPEARTYQFIFKLVPGARNAELFRLRAARAELATEVTDLRAEIRSLEALRPRAERADHLEAIVQDRDQRIAQLDFEVKRRDRDLVTTRHALEAARTDLNEAQQAAASHRAVTEQLRAQLAEHRHLVARANTARRDDVAATKEKLDAARKRRENETRRANRAEKEVEKIHSSETWRLGKAVKTGLAPAVWLKRRLDGRKPAPPAKKKTASAPTPTKPSTADQNAFLTPTHRLTEDTELRADYEAELARTTWSGTGTKVAFAIYTDDLDEARGDIYVAVGLGRHLRKLGWDVLYVPRERWDQVSPDTDYLVAMLPTFDPGVLPAGVRPIAWVRNEAQLWSEHASLQVFDAILSSSEAARDVLSAVYAGPIDILPIGVDTDLFRPSEPAPMRNGVATTVNQWGRERQVYAALRRRPITFPLAIYGNHVALDESLEPHRAGLVSYFSLPSLYNQVDAVIDDLNHTTKPYGNVNSRVFEALACGSTVITNSGRGLRELGLDELPAYVADAELHELAETANAGTFDDTTRRLAALVRERHSFAARAATFAALAEGWEDRRPPATEIVGYYPDYTSTNPYQRLLYGALGDDTMVLPVADPFKIVLADRARDAGARFTLHLHWTSPILAPANHEAEATRRLQRVLAELDRIQADGGRLIWTIHNAMPHEPRFPELERTLRQELALRATSIHVMCDRTADEVRDLYHLPQEKVEVIAHSSYLGVYPTVVDRATARERMGFTESDHVLVFLGGIRPYKGVDLLLDAFEVMHAARPETKLLIAGRPGRFPGVDELEDRCRATAGVQANFTTVPDDQLQLYYRAADVAVFPYRRGLNSGAVNLAFTFGVPVVAPGVGCVGELLEPELAESFVPGDVLSLQAALEASLRLRTSEARRAAAAAAAANPPEAMAEAFAALLER